MAAAPLSEASGFWFTTLPALSIASLFLDQAQSVPYISCLPLRASEFAALHRPLVLRDSLPKERVTSSRKPFPSPHLG